MDHVAILSTKLPWLERILAGKKTIESRWYRHRRVPWQQISVGDTIYFKNTGAPITAQALVSSTAFYHLGKEDTHAQILDRYSSDLGLLSTERAAFEKHVSLSNYVILIGLSDAQEIEPFAIDKRGFGAMAAWIVVPDITKIMM